MKKARIEIIPLIDIMFFLLATFVMVSLSMTKNQGVNVQLPGASTATQQDDPDKSTTLSVNAKNEVYFNKDKISLAQLPFRLQTLKGTQKDPRIIINSDGEVDFKVVVGVVDEVRKVGITKVGISTEKR
jgi:biopolymer transport protein ExbD